MSTSSVVRPPNGFELDDEPRDDQRATEPPPDLGPLAVSHKPVPPPSREPSPAEQLGIPAPRVDVHPISRAEAVTGREINPNAPMPGSFEGHPENLAGYVEEGPIKAVRGAARIAENIVPTGTGPVGPMGPVGPSKSIPEAARGVSEVLQGTGTTLAPMLPFSMAGAPISVGGGLLAGYGASKGVEALLNKTDLSPEVKQAATDAAWFLPSLAGHVIGARGFVAPEDNAAAAEAFGGKVRAGVAQTPEGVKVAGRVGPFKGSFTVPGTRPAPEPPAIEPPTIQGERGVPAGRPMPPEVANAVRAAGQKAQTELAAARVARGLPPTPAEAPPPQVQPPPMVNDATVAAVGSVIRALPPQHQPAAILETVKKAAESILHHGGAVIDHKVYPVTTHREALDLAKTIVNGEIAKQDSRFAVAGSEQGAKSDTALFQRAKKELGEGASISQVATRAQELKDQAASPETSIPALKEPKSVTHEQATPSAPPESIVRGGLEPNMTGASTQPQVNVERRLNQAERKRVAEMSPEELQRELLTSPVTNLPNRRAFDEAEHQPAPAVAMSDADGLKALNDKFGYKAGDALLRAKAVALREAGLEAYHEKGDEFLYRGESPEVLRSKLEQARANLRNKTIAVMLDDGSQLQFRGGDFSYGTGRQLSEAESGLKANKSEREARGERARGELRGIIATRSQAGETDQNRGRSLGGRGAAAEVTHAVFTERVPSVTAPQGAATQTGITKDVSDTENQNSRAAEGVQQDSSRAASESAPGRAEPPKKDQLGSQRGTATLDALLTPVTAPIEIAKRLNAAYDRFADAALQRSHLGRALPEVEAVDSDSARLFREYRAAPQYYRAKADHIVKSIVSDLTREQEKGFVLLADKASNDWLNENHHDEWIRYMDDPDIEVALAKYKPYENELREAQRALGGPVIEEDYLRRVYPKYVAGINKAKGGAVATFDRVVTPQMANKKGRMASPAYFYEKGLHEFAPSFATRYVATHLKLLESKIAADFMSKATKLDTGDSLPAYIVYNGERYYSPETIRLIRMSRANSAEGKRLAEELGVDQLPKPGEMKPYGIYTPFSGSRLESAARSMAENAIDAGKAAETIKPQEATPEQVGEIQGRAQKAAGQGYGVLHNLGIKYLGPREIVDAMERDGRDIVPQWVRDFSQVTAPLVGAIRQQILITGIPHIKNILRRVMQQSPGAQLDPRSWVRAWRVLFDRELKERALKGIDDPTFDALLKHAGISTEGAIQYEHYLHFNLDEGNWKNLWGTKDALAEAFAEPGVKGKVAGASRVAGELIRSVPTSKLGKYWHDKLFGPGGLDPRARLYIADLIKTETQEPDLTDAEIAERLNDQLGRYARSTWTDFQRTLAPFMMFPGWNYSSANWVLKHPFRTVLPAAFLILLANQIVNRYGKNRHRDRSDYKRFHIAGRSWSDTLLRERLALNDPLVQVPLDYMRARAQGKRSGAALGQALSGVSGDAGALLGEANPLVTIPIELASNRRHPSTFEPIYRKKDWGRRGRIIPKAAGGKGAEEVLGYGVGKMFPQLDAAYPRQGEGIDWLTLAGSNVGTSNFSEHRRRRGNIFPFTQSILGDETTSFTPAPVPPEGFEPEQPRTELSPEDLIPTPISEGDTVTLPDGKRGEITYVNHRMNVARVRVGNETRTVDLAEVGR